MIRHDERRVERRIGGGKPSISLARRPLYPLAVAAAAWPRPHARRARAGVDTPLPKTSSSTRDSSRSEPESR